MVSSDLSHYLPYDAARARDRDTARRDPRASTRASIPRRRAARRRSTACSRPRARRGLAAELVDLRNSGDTAGDRDRVVGYGAFAFHEPRAMPERGRAAPSLLAIARDGDRAARRRPTSRPAGRARGCASPARASSRCSSTASCAAASARSRRAAPLGDDVARNARAAAYRDPRFPPVTRRRAARACEVEVSVLSPREPHAARRARTRRSRSCARASTASCFEYGEPRADLPAAGVGEPARAARVPRRAEAQGGAAARASGIRTCASRATRWRSSRERARARRPRGRRSIPGRWWHRLDDGRIQCDLCPRDCRLHEGQRGACFVRARVGDAMVLTTYGRSSGFCVDPIEKKPLNHFLPGTRVLSFGTAGCNLACKFCQNWDISKSRDMDRLWTQATPEAIARAAARVGLPQRGLHLQRPGDLRRVRDGRGRRVPRGGHRSRVAVTAGYISPSRGASSTRRWTRPTST